MNIFDAVFSCFSKYVTFSGRARRSEYWYFWLFNTLVTLILGLILGGTSIVVTIYGLAILLPTLAVEWRRLHDIGKSGAWLLLSFVPVVGWIFLIVWFCREGDAGSNAYGPNPKRA